MPAGMFVAGRGSTVLVDQRCLIIRFPSVPVLLVPTELDDIGLVRELSDAESVHKPLRARILMPMKAESEEVESLLISCVPGIWQFICGACDHCRYNSL